MANLSAWSARVGAASAARSEDGWSEEAMKRADIRASTVGVSQWAPARWDGLPEWGRWGGAAWALASRRHGRMAFPLHDPEPCLPEPSGWSEECVVVVETRLGIVLVEAGEDGPGPMLAAGSQSGLLTVTLIGGSEPSSTEGHLAMLSLTGEMEALTQAQARWFGTGAQACGMLYRWRAEEEDSASDMSSALEPTHSEE